MSPLFVILTIQLAVPYPGTATEGEIVGTTLDTHQTFSTPEACNRAIEARNQNPNIDRNASWYYVVRDVATCLPLDITALQRAPRVTGPRRLTPAEQIMQDPVLKPPQLDSP